MIVQISIEPLKEDNLLIFTFGDRDISITLTDQQLDVLRDILDEYKKDNQGKTTKLYTVNLN